MCIVPLVSEQFLNMSYEVMCCIFKEDFKCYTSFTLRSPEHTISWNDCSQARLDSFKPLCLLG